MFRQLILRKVSVVNKRSKTGGGGGEGLLHVFAWNCLMCLSLKYCKKSCYEINS